MSSNGAHHPLNVAVASCSYDSDIVDPDELLERYHAMTGWADAVANTGAGAVTVVQRFGSEALLRRRSVEYRFVADRQPGSVRPWFLGARVAGVISDLQPDVVHVDGFVFPALVGCLRWRLPRQTAIVVQDHGGLPPGGLRKPARRVFYRLGLGAADAFMFTARDQAAPWQDGGVIRKRHALYEVPESSTDMASWPAIGGAKNVLPGRPAILWVGRLDANKDPLTALEGFARVAARLPEAALTMVYGEDLLLPAVEAWIAACPELRARIHLRGRVERKALPAFYDAADLFIIGSHREVACFSLIEALSFGVTPVVTNIPPFRALTADGRIGALFPPGNAGALAESIRLVSQGDLRGRRSSVRAHFERELSWSAVGGRALAAYRSAATGRRARVGAPWPS